MTVDVELEGRIAELVAARRPMLEQLVRERVHAELVALVDRELDAALERLAASNGATVSHARRSDPCARCGERPRLAGRTVCGPCRTARARERRATASTAAAADDGPRRG